MTCPTCQSPRWWIITDTFDRVLRECADCGVRAYPPDGGDVRDLADNRHRDDGGKTTNKWWNQAVNDDTAITKKDLRRWLDDAQRRVAENLYNQPPPPTDKDRIYFEGTPLIFDSHEMEGDEWKRRAAKDKAEKIDRMRQDSQSVESFLNSLKESQ